MNYGLEKINLPKLRVMANEMGLKSRRSKSQMIADISAAFAEYEEYHRNKIAKYTKVRQLGNCGKEGITYLVTDKKNHEFAMKTFRKTKSSVTLKKEYKLQKKGGKAGISPCVYEYDSVSKYIVMDVLNEHLLDVIRKQKGTLYKYQQKRIIEIFNKLDEIGIFHNDANLANYMLVGREIYIIDYGFAKPIDDRLCRKLGTSTPNMTFMLTGFILKLKELGCLPSAYKYLSPHLSKEDRQRFQI